jgi:hypothetical protein
VGPKANAATRTPSCCVAQQGSQRSVLVRVGCAEAPARKDQAFCGGVQRLGCTVHEDDLSLAVSYDDPEGEMIEHCKTCLGLQLRKFQP